MDIQGAQIAYASDFLNLLGASLTVKAPIASGTKKRNPQVIVLRNNEYGLSDENVNRTSKA